MTPRLTRSEHTAQTRARVLASAGNLFRRRGFHGASLEEISDDAGFSKGAIYSQFGSKDDLFFALIEDFIGVRAERILERIRNAPEGAELLEMWDQARQDQQADVAWELLIVEFRVHAARDPDLNRRFAELHRKRLAAVVEIFEELASRAGRTFPYDPADLARFISALDSGGLLERLIEGPGEAYDLSREALWQLLKSSAG